MQEDINPSIYIINLTPLVYKNLTFYRSFCKDLEQKLLITEIDCFSVLPENLALSPIEIENISFDPTQDLSGTACIFLSPNEDILILVWRFSSFHRRISVCE